MPVHLFQLHISGGSLYINRCKEILGRVLDTGQGLYAEMTVQRKRASRFALEGRSEQLKVDDFLKKINKFFKESVAGQEIRLKGQERQMCFS